MNARQKAKRFKRLYEVNIPRNPYFCNYRLYDKHHYKVSTTFTRNELKSIPITLIPDIVIDNLMSELRPLLRKYLQEQKNTEMDFTAYSIDLWF